MKIEINDKWGIKSNQHCVMLCKITNVEKDGKNKKVYRPKKYCNDLGQVLETYVSQRLRTEEKINSFRKLTKAHQELIKELKDIKEKLEKAFNQNIKITDSVLEKE